MECCAFCTASYYSIRPLYEALRKLYPTTLHRDVVHIVVDEDTDAFFFDYGAAVCWNMTMEEGRLLLPQLKPFEDEPRDDGDVEVDEFTFDYGDVARLRGGEIILRSRDPLDKLAVSHAMAQSVKLSTFEAAIHKTYNITKQIPQELAKYGSISLSRKAIRRKMGELFLERSSINLHLDVLDSPEMFWEYPELEPLYKLCAADEELEKRLEVLNKRLNILHELLEMLGNELNHQHSSRLEWTIIWLIIIEVVLTLLKDVFRIL